jgi:hypothetical protein
VNDAEEKRLLNELEEELSSQLNVCRLTKHVPFPRKTVKIINVPKVAPRTIWLNKPLNPGPDVVAHKLLAQAKYSAKGDEVVIYPWEEFEKCGLVGCSEQNNFGEIVLKGYFDIWYGAFSKVNVPDCQQQTPNAIVNVLDCQQQTPNSVPTKSPSMAYPFNLLQTSCTLPTITYEEVKRVATDAGWTYNSLMQAPANDDGIITFLFSTNADSIKFMGDFGDGVNSGTFSNFTFEREALDENGNMNVKALKDVNKEQMWVKFMNCVVAAKFNLKFLFT